MLHESNAARASNRRSGGEVSEETSIQRVHLGLDESDTDNELVKLIRWLRGVDVFDYDRSQVSLGISKDF